MTVTALYNQLNAMSDDDMEKLVRQHGGNIVEQYRGGGLSMYSVTPEIAQLATYMEHPLTRPRWYASKRHAMMLWLLGREIA
jgi:hypothetical protein